MTPDDGPPKKGGPGGRGGGGERGRGLEVRERGKSGRARANGVKRAAGRGSPRKDESGGESEARKGGKTGGGGGNAIFGGECRGGKFSVGFSAAGALAKGEGKNGRIRGREEKVKGGGMGEFFPHLRAPGLEKKGDGKGGPGGGFGQF